MIWWMALAWTIEFEPLAARQLARLDKPIAKRVVAYMREVAAEENPRARGKGLTGRLAGLWRYRVGDYRIIVDLHHDVAVVLVLDISHRSEAYGQ